jgi:F-type H+-transporting ATPase subunit gamma
MSGKLSEVATRIGTVHQLEAVITAMRGSAAARSREARGRLAGIRAYATVIGGAVKRSRSLRNPSRSRAHVGVPRGMSSSCSAPSKDLPAASTSGSWTPPSAI